jgi:hypothetical protein
MKKSHDDSAWREATRLTWPSACTLAIALVTASVFACADASSAAGVWVERVPPALPVDREWTYRLTLFEFGSDIGGHIEFFRIDGVCNTPQAPLFCVDDCVYFGPGVVRDSEFRVQVTDPDGAELVMQVRRGARRSLDVRVVSDGDGSGAVSLLMVPDEVNLPSDTCP